MTEYFFDSNVYSSIRRRLDNAVADAQGEYQCMDRRFVVHEGVFPPTHFQSTGIFTRLLPYPAGGAFLEIGCGAGVTAVTAALEGCRPVVASDISPTAVANTLANVALHEVSGIVSTRHGDLFDVLRPDERFDMIFWNSNFVFVPEDFEFEGESLRAFCDPGYAAHRRFLREAQRHMNPQGRLLIGFSSQGDERALLRLCGEFGYRSRVLASAYGVGPGAHRYDVRELLPVAGGNQPDAQ